MFPIHVAGFTGNMFSCDPEELKLYMFQFSWNLISKYRPR